MMHATDLHLARITVEAENERDRRIIMIMIVCIPKLLNKCTFPKNDIYVLYEIYIMCIKCGIIII